MMPRAFFSVVLVLSLGLGGCSTKPVIVSGDGPEEPVFTSERLIASDVQSPFQINDPLEGFNRMQTAGC